MVRSKTEKNRKTLMCKFTRVLLKGGIALHQRLRLTMLYNVSKRNNERSDQSFTSCTDGIFYLCVYVNVYTHR